MRWFGILGVMAFAGLAAAEEPAVLEVGHAVERRIAGKQPHNYQITLQAGEYAYVVAEQLGIDVILRVFGPDKKIIAESDFEGSKTGREFIGLVAKDVATYTVQVVARFPRLPEGGYSLTWTEERAATERDRQLAECLRLMYQSSAANTAGKYPESVALGEQALRLGEQVFVPDDPFVGNIWLRVGLSARADRDHAKSEAALKRSLAIFEKGYGRASAQTIWSLRGLGMLYLYTNDFAKSEAFFQEAKELSIQVLGVEHPQVVSSLVDLSKIHQYREDNQRMLADLQMAQPIAERVLEPDDFALMDLTNQLAEAYADAGDLERAEENHDKVKAIVARRYGEQHLFMAVPLQNLGILARRRGQYEQALSLLDQAYQIRMKTSGERHPDSVSIQINIANVYLSKGEYAKALDLHLREMQILEETQGRYNWLTLLAQANVARTYAAMGDLPNAIQAQTRLEATLEKNIELNVAIGSERQKLAYLTAKQPRSDRAVSLHAQMAPKDPAARDLAARVLLERKGRVLDAVSGSVGTLRERLGADDRRVLDDLAEVNAKYAKLALSGPGRTPVEEYRKQVKTLEEQGERLEAAISRTGAASEAASRLVSLEALEAVIPNDAAVVEFGIYRPFDPKFPDEDRAYGSARYIVYVLHHTGEVRWKDLGEVKKIDAAVDALRRSLGNSRRKDVGQLSRVLDRLVGAPIRELAGSARHLLISPDGELNLVPFEALVDENSRYFVERYSIGYLTAGRDLLRMQSRRSFKSGPPAVVADPKFGEPAVLAAGVQAPRGDSLGRRRSVTAGKTLADVYFAPLEGTAEEARKIQSIFPEARVLTGAQATKAALKRLESPGILHIATHGFFLDSSREVENPLLRSGLALAGANTGDGILTALEASGLNLWGTKVVTLSACETGVGEVKTHEGVYGLRRAFFLAGAETLVMSLWPVSDRVTREIMTDYYAGLKNGLGRGEALRQARLSMMKRKDRQHPFFWAGFIQSGEWRPLK